MPNTHSIAERQIDFALKKKKAKPKVIHQKDREVLNDFSKILMLRI